MTTPTYTDEWVRAQDCAVLQSKLVAAEAALATARDDALLMRRQLTEALIKVENDRTLWSEEWLVWASETKDALIGQPAPPSADQVPEVVGYTNYRGEHSYRSIIPQRVWYGSTEYHPNPQWFLKAFDTDKQAERDFALCDFGEAPSQPACHLTSARGFSHRSRPVER